MRITAGAMGTSIATTLWESRTALHHVHMTELMNQSNSAFTSALQGMKSTGMTTEQAMIQINRMIDQQAFTRAADDIFLGSSFVFLLLISLIWLTKRPLSHKTSDASDAGGAH